MAQDTIGRVEFFVPEDDGMTVPTEESSAVEIDNLRQPPSNESTDAMLESSNQSYAMLGEEFNQMLIIVGIILCILVLLLKFGRSRRK